MRDNLAELLRNRRHEMKLSQSELARRAQVTQGYISRLELGKDIPTIDVMDRIAHVLEVRVDYFTHKHDSTSDTFGIQTLSDLEVMYENGEYDVMITTVASAEGAEYFRDEDEHSKLLLWSAFAHKKLGNYYKSLEICGSIHNATGWIATIKHLLIGINNYFLGDYNTARREIKYAYRILPEDRNSVSNLIRNKILHYLGLVYIAMDRLNEASKYLLEAVDKISVEVRSNVKQCADILSALVNLEVSGKKYEQALRHANKMLQYCTFISDTCGACSAHIAIAQVYDAMGDTAKSSQSYARVAKMYEKHRCVKPDYIEKLLREKGYNV